MCQKAFGAFYAPLVNVDPAGLAWTRGEPARWRSATFVAVSGLVDGQLTDAAFHVAFKARAGQVDGIYLRKGPGASPVTPVVESGMDGTQIDPGAVYVD